MIEPLSRVLELTGIFRVTLAHPGCSRMKHHYPPPAPAAPVPFHMKKHLLVTWYGPVENFFLSHDRKVHPGPHLLRDYSLELRVTSAGAQGPKMPGPHRGAPGPAPRCWHRASATGHQRPASPAILAETLKTRQAFDPRTKQDQLSQGWTRGPQVMTGAGGQVGAVPKRAGWAFQRRHSTQI